MTNYTIYDVVGKHPEMLFPAESRETVLSLLTQISDGDQLVAVEIPIRSKKGDVRLVLWNTANIYSADGKTIIATIAHGQDITERKRVEEAIQESELRFRSLYENATIGIYRTTPDGTILMANPALVKLLGYTSFEKLAERNLEKDGFEPSYQRKEFLDKIERNGVVTGYESKWIRQDGTAIFVLESARAIRDSHDKTLYYDGTVEDITERKVLEEQMHQMQKLESLGTLAGGIAHDFNNILGIILAYTTTINRLKNDPEKLERAVDTISKAVQRGTTLVRQILTFARKSDTDFGIVSINDVAKEVIDMILETFPRTLSYSQNLQKGIPAINADRSQIHQALLNLCVNARDAMPDGGVLTINTSMVDGTTLRNQHPDALASPYICVEVSDTGIGMTEEVRNRIFEPFYTTKEKGKGTGLGLAVVFGVVKTHKGFVEVESELGKGTTFRLHFPVLPEAMPAQSEIQEVVEEIPGGTETLLVVEDEETLMTFIQISLTAKGYTVLSAVDGPEAVKTYRERHNEISVVFTDLGLPGMTGMEEINLIKKINPDVKIIVATGYLDPEMKSELLKAGVKKYILKPYNFEEILKLVREVLDEK
jgi:PAS domain S-box-containing protein